MCLYYEGTKYSKFNRYIVLSKHVYSIDSQPHVSKLTQEKENDVSNQTVVITKAHGATISSKGSLVN